LDYSFLGKYQIYTKEINFFPIDWSKIFCNNKKLIVEIGFGGGEFLVGLAKKYPEFNYIGIETSLISCYKIQKKIFTSNLSNIRIILEDARFAIREFFSDDSIYKVIVNFPCPWPKKKHSKKRLFTGDFIDTLSSVLEPNGEVLLTTDVQWYAQEVKNGFMRNGCFDVSPLKTNFEMPIKTRYEAKWETEGRSKFLLISRKKSKKPIRRLIEGENILSHKKIKSINLSKLKSLKNYKYKHADTVFFVSDVYNNCSNPESNYLLKIFSNDNGFFQSFFIEVSKGNNNWLVKLDDIAKAYRTPAVKEAVNKIAEELKE
jgi:tRNA (guanine-N7-)-methyltransferase